MWRWPYIIERQMLLTRVCIRDSMMNFMMEEMLCLKVRLIAWFHYLGLDCLALRKCRLVECQLKISSRSFLPSKKLSCRESKTLMRYFPTCRCFTLISAVEISSSIELSNDRQMVWSFHNHVAWYANMIPVPRWTICNVNAAV